ncbi:MAG TPA: N-acetylmuramic acid 6-phosphate etherase [Terriglobales bacterium]
MSRSKRGKGTARNLSGLSTEKLNPAAKNLDLKSSLEIARIINREDAKVAAAVKRALPQIARGIDVMAGALSQNGRLIYVGAGTSGRIAALDAAELPPTFSLNPRRIQLVIAGGTKALSSAVEKEEDSPRLGESAITRKNPAEKDVVVGVSASGRTPFTVAALKYARSRCATTIAITCNRNSPLEKSADLAIVTDVGPEVVSGSSRMKAGTAQKMILNMLSTGAMTRLGYVYDGLMVNVVPKNSKLKERAISILQQAAGISRAPAKSALKQAGNSVPAALVMLLSGSTCSQATRALKKSRNHLRQAIIESSNQERSNH